MICRESETTLADSVVQQLFYQVLKVCIAFLDYFEFINFCFYSDNSDDGNGFDNVATLLFLLLMMLLMMTNDGDVNAFDNDYC